MGTLICPYCYNRFSGRDVHYRCTGLMGRNGKQCNRRERDERLLAQLGVSIALPPSFEARGGRDTALCTGCQNPTAQRLCPYCHSLLPVHYGKIDSRLVAMIGAKFSGKTVYTTVLLHELMHRVGQRFEAAVVGSDDRTREAFFKDQQDLYVERALPPPTQAANAARKPPLVFKLSRNERGRFGTRQHHTIMSFFDTAGEDLVSEESVRLNVRYLAAAGGVILLLDPLQMPGARETVGPRRSLPPLVPAVDQPINVLSRVTDLLHQAGRGGPGRLIEVPIAVAFSKIDALWDGLPADSPVRQPPPATPALLHSDCDSVHESVRALLNRWDGAQIDQYLNTHYRRYHFFALSALGAMPIEERVSGRGVQPHRVEDPFLWLLGAFGAIPTEE